MKRIETMMPVERFIADDGTMFKTKQECIDYEDFIFMKEHISIFNEDGEMLSFSTKEEFNDRIKEIVYVIFNGKDVVTYFNKYYVNTFFLISKEPYWDEESMYEGKNIWYIKDFTWCNFVAEYDKALADLVRMKCLCDKIIKE